MAATQKMRNPRYEEGTAPSPIAGTTANDLPGAATAADVSLAAAPAVDAEPQTTGLAADEATESRHEAIAQAAYFLAQARAFEPGHELDDWLAAEQQIDAPRERRQ